ncbi:MAG TPA: PepSY domain-containing protein [Rhodanobacter sp.]|jgi:hypothetical protein|nr:PepSY domain-containing protein [Rhodanobacter sp.]
MPPNHRLLRFLRTTHLYLGVFTAPMLLFFAVTGGLQTFSLHETIRDSSYVPPVWLATAAQWHKKQNVVVPPAKLRLEPALIANPPLSTASRAVTRANVASQPKRNPLPMKVFFALIALGLFTSVLSGLYMAWRFSRRPGLFGAVLLGGAVSPLLLLLI